MWRLLRPLLFLLPPETAHHVAMRAFAMLTALSPIRALVRRWYRVDDPRQRVELLGMQFPGPVGLAAGFDKDARWFNALGALGFDHIEVGTLTGQGQPGNPQPRLFRLPADRALVNRFGFNNRGSDDAAARLAASDIEPILGINIGKSKVVPNEEAVADYLASFDRLAPHARYITVNVSSPNTQGLRALQEREALSELLGAIVARNGERAEQTGSEPLPVLVKIAPDMDEAQRDEIVELAVELGLSGIIATNTTVSRDALTTPRERVDALGAGGLSGAPLTEVSRAFVASLYRRAAGRLPIIGVGGIMNGDDAWEMLRAGASMVQVYTGFVYGGPGFVRDLHRTISRRLDDRGVGSLSEIVGEASEVDSR